MTSLLCDLVRFVWLSMRPHGALAAEYLFLRKQLAMYQERKLKPRRPQIQRSGLALCCCPDSSIGSMHSLLSKPKPWSAGTAKAFAFSGA